MSVLVKLACGGCEATAEYALRRRSEVVQPNAVRINGVVCDKCLIVTDDIEDRAAADGWVAWDPYTFATYCPACWAGIVADSPPAEREASTR